MGASALLDTSVKLLGYILYDIAFHFEFGVFHAINSHEICFDY